MDLVCKKITQQLRSPSLMANKVLCSADIFICFVQKNAYVQLFHYHFWSQKTQVFPMIIVKVGKFQL